MEEVEEGKGNKLQLQWKTRGGGKFSLQQCANVLGQ